MRVTVLGKTSVYLFLTIKPTCFYNTSFSTKFAHGNLFTKHVVFNKYLKAYISELLKTLFNETKKGLFAQYLFPFRTGKIM